MASGRAERDIFADRAVEEKRVLQHHAELRAVGVQPHCGKIDAVHQHACPALGTWKAAIRPMMVDLPEPDGPTSAVTVPGCDSKLTSCSTGLPAS